jgi:hypothetical protein
MVVFESSDRCKTRADKKNRESHGRSAACAGALSGEANSVVSKARDFSEDLLLNQKKTLFGKKDSFLRESSFPSEMRL